MTTLYTQLIETFTRIEVQDVQVGTVEIPQRVFTKLMCDQHFHESVGNPGIQGLRTGHFSKGDTIGYLWGAEMVLSEHFRACGMPGFQHISSPVFYDNFFPHLDIIVKSRSDFPDQIPKQEWTALNTLRDMISESDFRKYLKYGFILVKADSGLTYQIWRRKAHVIAWYNGKIVKEVCVYVTDKTIPLTDKVIAFKTIIETSEEEFLKMGNVYKMADTA